MFQRVHRGEYIATSPHPGFVAFIRATHLDSLTVLRYNIIWDATASQPFATLPCKERAYSSGDTIAVAVAVCG